MRRLNSLIFFQRVRFLGQSSISDRDNSSGYPKRQFLAEFFWGSMAKSLCVISGDFAETSIVVSKARFDPEKSNEKSGNVLAMTTTTDLHKLDAQHRIASCEMAKRFISANKIQEKLGSYLCS